MLVRLVFIGFMRRSCTMYNNFSTFSHQSVRCCMLYNNLAIFHDMELFLGANGVFSATILKITRDFLAYCCTKYNMFGANLA